MPKGDNDDLDLGIEDEDEDEDEVLDDEEDESEDGADGADDDEDDSEDEGKAPSKSEKRIRDLQSKLDKATAEANQLRKQTAAKPKAGAKPRDPEVEALMQFALDQSRTQLYASEPRLKEYGLGADVISGSTPEEMTASLKSVKRLISRVETGARNKTLREHGFSPAPKDAGADKPRNYSAMDSKEFERLVKETSGI